MENVIAAVKGINWSLLRRQKRKVSDMHHGCIDSAREGILALLDSIQDAYVADGLATEKDVFGTQLVVVNLPVHITAKVVDVQTVQDALLIGWGDNTFSWDLKLPEDSHDFSWNVSDAMICDAVNLVTGEETEHEMHDVADSFERGSNSFELRFYGFISVEVDNATSVEDAISIAESLDFSGEIKAHDKKCTYEWTFSDGVESHVVYEGETLDKYEVFVDDFSQDGPDENDGNFYVEILQHNVKCFLRDEGDESAPTELDDSSIEHVTGLITEGYREGELVVYDSEGTEWRGWWSLK